MLTHREWEIVEHLLDLDPAWSYPRRGAERVAELAGTRAYRLRLRDDFYQSEPAPDGEPALRLALAVDGDHFGELELHGALVPDGPHLAERGARLFARGLRSARRLEGRTGVRTAEEIQAMLADTTLTPRERDVVARLLSGATTREMASSTGLTVATINTYLKRVFGKLGVHSRVELMARMTGASSLVSAADEPGSTPP
ncbi:MAG: hypothetical protein KF729_07960 [Sandaracinaceae bacterium]|nr:hypothetical protein [Sandaracinaceae bacterium]